jgi:DNA-binding SARP family transcriptional activator/tetratricopeptide (TPR) repeat protein
MRFRMLGPLEVRSEAGWAGISAGKWRSLLACLLLKPGQIVPTETLIHELWGDAPPPTANNLVSIYVHRLRGVIGNSEGRVLVHRKPGYQLRVADDDTDVRKFETLVVAARSVLAGGDAETAATLLGEAEGLWRGGLLADVAPTVLVSAESERMVELRLAAAELRIGADLTCGRHAEVVPELRSLVAEHSLREGLWLLLMRALDGAGRHAEALETYGQAREVISDELGVDPGPELQRLYADLLAADAAPPHVPPQRPPTAAGVWAAAGTEPPGSAVPGLYTAEAGPAAGTEPGTPVACGRDTPRAGAVGDDTDEAVTGAAQGTIALGGLAEETGDASALGDMVAGAVAAGAPARLAGPDEPPLPRLAQLPADIGDFTGRTPEVRHLCGMLTRRDAASGPGAVRIAVVAGAAGLGKTTLAVHAAHQVRDLFPDGQLYADLSGASAQPAAPGEVLARFLRDLGVDGDKVPAGDDERAALYRTRLTGRRVLIMLDNARDVAQVRPLLPGTASCAVLVTTRNRAMALESTRLVDLNTLSDSEALELFIRLVGDGRPAAEPDATAEVLLACAGLPLAIRICAARLAARRQWKVATMASRLRDKQRRLDELQTGDLEVRASFQVSYDALRTGRHRVDPARAFRLLGLWQGQAVSLPAATALIGSRDGDVAEVLERLVDANLLESPAPDWYRFHDLLRVYATERAEDEEPAEARGQAIGRLLRWYLGTAENAADIVSPRRYRIPAEQAEEGQGKQCEPPAPLSFLPEDVFEWYDGERGNLIAAARQAASAALDDVAWRLPTALFPLYNRRGDWTDCVTAHRVAAASAHTAGNRRGEAWALQNLGQALAKLGDIEALGHLERALAIREELCDRVGEAQTAISVADIYHKLQGAEVALGHSDHCLKVLREVGNDFLLAIGLNNHGEFCLDLHRLDEAADCFREVLAMPRDVAGYVSGYALHNLGWVQLRKGRAVDAIASLNEAHAMHLASGDLMAQATALKYLGQAQWDAGEEDEARQSWSAALVIFQDLKADAEVEAISTALAA